MDNKEEMNKFLEKYNFPKLDQEEIENLNRPITSTEIETVIRNLLGRLSYLSLPFFGTLHSDGYVFPFLLCLSLLFSALCKFSSDNHFAFWHFFFLGMVLITHLLYSVMNL